MELSPPKNMQAQVIGSEPKLFEWQKDHAAKLLASLLEHGYAKDGSDTGTGKTIVALSVCKALGLAPFVICPKAVIPSWNEWIHDFGFDQSLVINYEKLRLGNTPYYKQRRGFALKVDKVLIIFDEDHRCKGSKSENAKMMIAAKRGGYQSLLLGATSATNPVEMRAIGFMLDLHDERGWWNWCLKNGCKRGTFGGLTYTGSQAALKRIHDHIYGQGRGSRLRVNDLPPGSFPDSMIVAEGYEVASRGEIEKIYADLKLELEILDDRKKEDEESALIAQLRARQEVELLKVNVFEELAKDALEGGASVAIFVNFRQTLELLYRRLHVGDCKIAVVHGTQDEIDRDKEVKRFQSNEAKIIICMVQAGGTGLSLHDLSGKHPRVSLISPNFSAVDLKQVLGRVHRAGAKSPAVQKIVFASDTVEMRVCRAVRKKLNNLDLINDDEMNPIL